MEAADEEGDENGRIDFPEFLAVMSKVVDQMMISLKMIPPKGRCGQVLDFSNHESVKLK